MKTMKWIFILMITPAVIMSCKRASEKTGEEAMEKAIEQSTGENAEVDLSDGSGTISTESGSVTYDTKINSWPATIPSEVPEFKFGKINGGSHSQTDEAETWMVMLIELPESALVEYDKLLKNKGFETHFVNMGNKGGTIAAEKGDLIVSYMGGEGKGSLSVQKRKQ